MSVPPSVNICTEEAVPQPVVKRRCASCVKQGGDWSGPGVISPNGIEHAGADYGLTECGKDATGDNWWWPL